MNVNRFVESVCGLDTTHLRTNSRAAHNIRLKEIKKRRALIGKQRVELLMNRVGKRTVVLLNPSFFYFFNPFFVSCKFNATPKVSAKFAGQHFKQRRESRKPIRVGIKKLSP